MSPDPSFCWKAGRVENIRQSVDTTTNRQETMATTWTVDMWTGTQQRCWSVHVCLPLLPASGEGFQKGSIDGAESEHKSLFQNLPPFLLDLVAAEATQPCSKYADSMAPCGDHPDPSTQAPRRSLARKPEYEMWG